MNNRIRRIIAKGSVIAMVFTMFVSITGCGRKDSWEDEEIVYGDIDLEAEEVDRNDFDSELDIDKYLTFEEQNQNDKEHLTNDEFRIYYNKIGSQLDLPLLYMYNADITDSNGYTLYNLSDSLTGCYIYDNEDGYISQIKSEVNISYVEDDEESFKQEMVKVFAPIYGGVPYLKKFDINQMFLDMQSALSETDGVYSTTFNGISITVERDYYWLTTTISL